jgi:DNA-binding response OmpR family regulator
MNRILYAEDDRQVADLVLLFFQSDAPDITVEVSPDGRDCLERMSRGGFDLLLLDLVLPGRDGFSILSDLALRGDPTPVVVLSSHGQVEQTVSALRAGAIDCIDKKTGRFSQVARIVRNHLERSENERAGVFPLKAADRDEKKTAVLLERNEDISSEIATILGAECPHLRIQTISTRTDWDRLVATESSCDAVIVSDDWEISDIADVLRDFRSFGRGGPAILLSRTQRFESVTVAFALGCRDCVVQKPGYHFELARSLNHLLRGHAAFSKR